MTDSAFARKRGLKIGRIAWWRQKLGRLHRKEEKSATKPKPNRHAGEFVEFKAYGLIHAIVGIDDLDEVLSRIVSAVMDLMSADRASSGVLCENRDAKRNDS